jgi:hypothetical protein
VDAVTVGALDAVIEVATNGALFKYEHEHISTIEYTMDCPLVMVVSVHVVVSREEDVHADADADDPVTLVTLQDLKLQYELEQAFAPADQLTVIEEGVEYDEENVADEGVLAVIRAEEDADKLFAVEHVQPSTTE